MGNCYGEPLPQGIIVCQKEISLRCDHEEFITSDYELTEFDEFDEFSEDICQSRIIRKEKTTIELKLVHSDIFLLFRAYARYYSAHHEVFQQLLKRGTRKQKQAFMSKILYRVKKYYGLRITPKEMNNFKRRPCKKDDSFYGTVMVNGSKFKMLELTPMIPISSNEPSLYRLKLKADF